MSYKIKQLLEKQKRTTIYTLHGSQNLEEALDAMSMHRIHHVPIVQQGTAKEGDYGVLEGIISDRDLRLVTQSPLYYDGANQKGDRHSKKNIESLEEGLSELIKSLSDHTISEVMTKKVFTLHEDDEVIKAVRLMREADISAIPIVRDNNALVGIVSRADMLDELIGFLTK